MMNLSELDPEHNVITGTVLKDGKEAFQISGQVGIKVELTRTESDEKIVLYTEQDTHTDAISYPPVSSTTVFLSYCGLAECPTENGLIITVEDHF